MEDRNPCLITADEERAVIIGTFVRELRILESEAGQTFGRSVLQCSARTSHAS